MLRRPVPLARRSCWPPAGPNHEHQPIVWPDGLAENCFGDDILVDERRHENVALSRPGQTTDRRSRVTVTCTHTPDPLKVSLQQKASYSTQTLEDSIAKTKSHLSPSLMRPIMLPPLDSCIISKRTLRNQSAPARRQDRRPRAAPRGRRSERVHVHL